MFKLMDKKIFTNLRLKVLFILTYGLILSLFCFLQDSGDDSGFEKVYEQCVRCCKAFLEKS